MRKKDFIVTMDLDKDCPLYDKDDIYQCNFHLMENPNIINDHDRCCEKNINDRPPHCPFKDITQMDILKSKSTMWYKSNVVQGDGFDIDVILTRERTCDILWIKGDLWHMEKWFHKIPLDLDDGCAQYIPLEQAIISARILKNQWMEARDVFEQRMRGLNILTDEHLGVLFKK